MGWTEYRTVKTDFKDELLMVELKIEKERGDFGADADGGRGERRDFIVSVEIDAVFDLETGRDLTNELKDNAALLAAARRGL